VTVATAYPQFFATSLKSEWLPNGQRGIDEPSTKAVAQRTANSYAHFWLANCPRLPNETDSPSSFKMQARAMNVLPDLMLDG